MEHVLTQQGRHEAHPDQAVAEEGLPLHLAINGRPAIQCNGGRLIAQPARRIECRQVGRQRGGHGTFPRTGVEPLARWAVQSHLGKPAVQHAAFVDTLISPVSVILGHDQLLPGFIPLRQTDDLLLRLVQQALNGGDEFGMRRILVMPFQALDDGACLISRESTDQADQHQQRRDEGERNVLDGQVGGPIHGDGNGLMV